MSETKKYSLKWANFKENTAATFTSLLNEDDYKDITLVSDDNHQIGAHKVVLISSSGFFKNLFAKNRDRNHPLVYMKGINFKELDAIIKFIYKGEVDVDKDGIEDFLRIGFDLHIKGLRDSRNKKEDRATKQESVADIEHNGQAICKEFPDYLKSKECNESSFLDMNDTEFEQSMGKEERAIKITLLDDLLPINENFKVGQTAEGMGDISHVEKIYNCDYCPFTSMIMEHLRKHIMIEHSVKSSIPNKVMKQEADDYLKHASTMKSADELLRFVETLEGPPKLYTCSICNDFTSARKTHVRNHLESIHFKGVFSYTCQFCEKIITGRNALAVHTSSYHSLLSKHTNSK